MLQVKLFTFGKRQELEDAINKFLANLNNLVSSRLIDIKFAFNPESEFDTRSYVALVICET